MIKFLGSVYFALFLIGTTALGVIVGTFIESKTGSHISAEAWIYSNPFFYLLLLGYFLNILISALLRYPFKKHHIPFLITHLGLLMVISGVFIKALFGVQGHVRLIEGTYTDQLILPNVPAIALYGKTSSYSIPLKKIAKAPLKMEILDQSPHGEEKYLAWDDLHEIIASPPIDLSDTFSSNVKEETVELQFQNSTQSFDRKKLSKFITYDEGFHGYSVFAEFPFSTPQAVDKAIIQELKEAKNAPLSPPLILVQKVGVEKFPKRVSKILRAWKEQGKWLYTSHEKWLEKLPWTMLHPDELKALYWTAELFDQQEQEILNKFPFKAGSERSFLAMQEQLYSAKKELPPCPLPPYSAERASQMLTAYFRLFSIHLDTIPLKETGEIATLESPLKRVVEKKTPLAKAEDNTPYLFLRVNGENIPLVYDPQFTALKWPLKDHSYLIRYEPQRVRLPYTVRLHQAKEIKYPSSEQTLSYECTLSLTDAAGSTTKCTLSMNEVYETRDGYRFYLAGMGPLDRYGVKNVQLVVNRDPAKYHLTYPGGLLVSLGILLLYKRKFT